MDNYILNNNISIPSIGLGTWQITDRDILYNILKNGVELGYNLVDTASAYGNELSIGKFIKENNSIREKLFIQDKVWNTDKGYNEVQVACKKSLKKLKIEYLDAYLIHWPASMKLYDNWKEINAETYRGMEQLYKEGLVRSIGVCNFKVHHIEELLKTSSIIPMINQVEMHPGLIDYSLMEFCNNNNIQIEASSPLGNGQVLNNDVLSNIAIKYNITTPQLILKWLFDKSVVVIPKTSSIDRLKENIDIYNINISDDDKKAIDNLDFIGGLNYDSDEVTCFG